MEYVDGVVTVIAETATNRVAPVLSSSDTARLHCKLYNLRPKRTILDITLNMSSL